jgi:hypothetical protein
MKGFVWAALMGLGVAGFTPAAVAQGRDFYLMQYNSTVRDMNKLVDRINALKTDIRTEKDFTRGCSMLADLIYEMKQAQILSEKLADYAYQIDDMESHRNAVDQHNAYLEERRFWEEQRDRMCR